MLCQDSAKQRMGPVTRADRIGDRGLPWGVPSSGCRGLVMKLLNDIVTSRHVMKSFTHAIV